MVGIFDCGGVLGKYEIRLKERKVVNMEALNTYKTEKTSITLDYDDTEKEE